MLVPGRFPACPFHPQSHRPPGSPSCTLFQPVFRHRRARKDILHRNKMNIYNQTYKDDLWHQPLDSECLPFWNDWSKCPWSRLHSTDSCSTDRHILQPSGWNWPSCWCLQRTCLCHHNEKGHGSKLLTYIPKEFWVSYRIRNSKVACPQWGLTC